MTTLDMRRGGALPDAAPQPQDSHPGQQSSATGVTTVAVAEVLPPAGRRTLAVLLVRSCPSCQHAHVHRGELGERRPSCGGAPYLLLVDGVIA